MKAFLVVLVLAGTAWGQVNPAYQRFQEEQRIREQNAEYEHEIHQAPRRLATTAPAATQATPQSQLDAAMTAAAAATADAERTRAAAVARAQATPAYQAAKARQDAAQAILEAARRSGTPQERIDASGKFVAAKQVVDKIVADAVAADDDARTAAIVAGRAKDAVAAARAAVAQTAEDAKVEDRRHISVDAKVGDAGVPFGLFTVVSVIDRGNMIANLSTPRGGTCNVWMRGWDMSGITDGTRFRLNYPVMVTGTTQYQTVAGTAATVLVLEPEPANRPLSFGPR